MKARLANKPPNELAKGFLDALERRFGCKAFVTDEHFVIATTSQPSIQSLLGELIGSDVEQMIRKNKCLAREGLHVLNARTEEEFTAILGFGNGPWRGALVLLDPDHCPDDLFMAALTTARLLDGQALTVKAPPKEEQRW